MPHHFKLLGSRTSNPTRLVRIAVLAFAVGILTSWIFIIHLGCTEGSQNLRTSPFAPDGQSVRNYDKMVATIINTCSMTLSLEALE